MPIKNGCDVFSISMISTRPEAGFIPLTRNPAFASFSRYEIFELLEGDGVKVYLTDGMQLCLRKEQLLAENFLTLKIDEVFARRKEASAKIFLIATTFLSGMDIKV